MSRRRPTVLDRCSTSHCPFRRAARVAQTCCPSHSRMLPTDRHTGCRRACAAVLPWPWPAIASSRSYCRRRCRCQILFPRSLKGKNRRMWCTTDGICRVERCLCRALLTYRSQPLIRRRRWRRSMVAAGSRYRGCGRVLRLQGRVQARYLCCSADHR